MLGVEEGKKRGVCRDIVFNFRKGKGGKEGEEKVKIEGRMRKEGRKEGEDSKTEEGMRKEGREEGRKEGARFLVSHHVQWRL